MKENNRKLEEEHNRKDEKKLEINEIIGQLQYKKMVFTFEKKRRSLQKTGVHFSAEESL